MKNKVRKGAASFYIVAFSTLILVVIATSFATVIISEITRSENDDLSQSAYDSALAGVEDAKVAYASYRRCAEAGVTSGSITGGTNITCSDIVYWMQHPDCDMVGHILGKIPKNANNQEVVVGATYTTSAGSEESVMNQAYTCVKIDTNLSDYRATLSSNNMAQVIRAAVADGGTNNVSKVKLSWHSVRNDNGGFLKYSNFQNNRVVFGARSSSTIAVPPTLEMQIIQTGTSFNLGQFDIVESGRTNRGTVYLVPESSATGSGTNYIGAWNSGAHKNIITANQVVKTNDHTVSNKPFAVYCNPNSSEDFYCSVEIELPGVIGGGGRFNDTFMIGVALPYQVPDTDFSIELICNDGSGCGGTGVMNSAGENAVQIQNTQVAIDSTGRANDLHRRVETRIETSDRPFGFGSPFYALQILGNGGAKKKMNVTYENAFYF